MIELIGVPVGAKLRLHGGIVGEILECIDDEWVKIKLLQSDRPNAKPRPSRRSYGPGGTAWLG